MAFDLATVGRLHISSYEQGQRSACFCAPSQPGSTSNPPDYQRFDELRQRADKALKCAVEFEAKNKKLEQEVSNKDQEIQSLSHKLTTAETELGSAQSGLSNADHVRDELDNVEKDLEDTLERCVHTTDHGSSPDPHVVHPFRLRQMELRAKQFEQQVHDLELERDGFETNYNVRQMNQRLFPLHNLSVYRISSRSMMGSTMGSTSSPTALKRVYRITIVVSQLYVWYRADDSIGCILTLSITAWLTHHIRRTLTTLKIIQFMYLTTFSTKISIISIHSSRNRSDTELTQ